MIDSRDPEAPALRRDAHWRLSAEFLRGTIGEATYLRSLFILGYLPAEAQTELAHLKMEMARRVSMNMRSTNPTKNPPGEIGQ
jgi:hypothetical protein